MEVHGYILKVILAQDYYFCMRAVNFFIQNKIAGYNTKDNRIL